MFLACYIHQYICFDIRIIRSCDVKHLKNSSVKCDNHTATRRLQECLSCVQQIPAAQVGQLLCRNAGRVLAAAATRRRTGQFRFGIICSCQLPCDPSLFFCWKWPRIYFIIGMISATLHTESGSMCALWHSFVFILFLEILLVSSFSWLNWLKTQQTFHLDAKSL